MNSKRKLDGNDNGSLPNKKFKCSSCEKSFDRYLNKRYHEQSTHDREFKRQRTDLVGGSKKDESNTDSYTLNEYISDKSIDEQPYQKVVIEDIENLDELKRNIQRVIRKRLSVASQALKYTINVDVIFHKPLDDIITDPPVTFRTDVPTVLGKYDVEDIDEHISNFIQKLEVNIDEYTENGSGWRFEKIVRIEIKLLQYDPVTGNKFLPLPSYIAKKQAVINVKNNDEKCFLWSILAALHPQAKDSQRVTKYIEYKDELDCEDISFPVDPLQHKVLDRFCAKNDISLNILMADQQNEKDISFQLLHSTKELRDRHINLLLIMDNDGQAHYTWLKDLSRLMAGRDGHKHKAHRFYCNLCLSAR